jgi:hypothetical protein
VSDTDRPTARPPTAWLLLWRLLDRDLSLAPVLSNFALDRSCAPHVLYALSRAFLDLLEKHVG